ncbi:MAG TPA: hypothetical protein VGF99_08710 [Myxococcota bacterium]
MRTPKVYDGDDEFWRTAFFDVAAMNTIEPLCPRCKQPLLVLNTRALMVEHDKNAGLYCFNKQPVCFVAMFALRPDFKPHDL